MSDSEKKKEKKKEKKEKKPKRLERRFVPHSSTNPWVVRALGGVAALLLGSGLYAYFYATTFAKENFSTYYTADWIQNLPAYAISAGAVLMAAAIWLGTSSDAPVRVGDPGIAIEKGETRRIPWWGVKSISFESGSLALVVSGKDEANSTFTFKVSLKSHPEAIGWIVKEADDRIPKKLDISDDVFAKLPQAGEHAGQRLELEPLQVVGKKCAVTGKTITYEPDARVCKRCERVYAKRSVPKKCKCGANLEEMRTAAAANEPDEEPVDEELEDEEEEESEEAAPAEAASESTKAEKRETAES